MDVKSQVETVQEQLPQIRRVITLDEIKRIEPPKILPQPLKKEPIKRKPDLPKLSVKIFLIGLIFFAVLGVELAIIYRYDKLNKRLYQISISLKDRLMQINRELKQVNRVKTKITKNRNNLLQAYRQRGFLYDRLQFKENDYKRLLISKASWSGVVQGDLRVAIAQIEALKVQRELLASQVREKDERIRQLTTQLLNNIGEQELLINENLKLRKERDQLTVELTAIRDEK